MRVTNIDLYSSSSLGPFTNQVANFSFRDPASNNPYIVKAIAGLDADEIVSMFYNGPNNAKYYNFGLEKRTIVVRMVLNPLFETNQSYSDLRDELYKAISSSRTGELQLRFNNGEVTTAVISGLVVKLEAGLFNKEPEVQLTLDCSNGMLKALEPIINTNEEELNAVSETLTITDDISTAPHGFGFTLEFTDDVNSFEMGNSDGAFTVTPGTIGAVDGFLTGEILWFSSERNNRYIYVVRSSEAIHLADKIAPGSIWPVLFPGTNEWYCPATVEWKSVTHYPTYWGV